MGKLKTFIEEIKSSEFFKNVFILSSGTALAQLIPVMIAPILSRIYSPEEFGRLALYLAIIQILGSLSTGRYELAILLPKEEKRGVQLTLISIFFTVVVSFISLIVVLVYNTELAVLLGDPKLDVWLYLVPVSVLMVGVFNALNYYNTRVKKFKNIARANIYKSSGGGVVQLVLGGLKLTSGGLILGQTLSHFFGNIRLSKTLLENKETILDSKIPELKDLAKRYIDFPKFSMWGIFLNSLSANVINMFVSRVFSLSTVGFYSLAYRYLGLPSTLVGNAFSQVYMVEASESRRKKGNAKEEFLGVLKKLSVVSLLFLIIGVFFVEEVFVIVFGEEWRFSGKYARILIPLFAIRLVVTALSVTFSVFEKQRESLIWNIILVAASIFAMIISYLCNMEMTLFLYLYSGTLSVFYLVLLYRAYKISKGTN